MNVFLCRVKIGFLATTVHGSGGLTKEIDRIIRWQTLEMTEGKGEGERECKKAIKKLSMQINYINN